MQSVVDGGGIHGERVALSKGKRNIEKKGAWGQACSHWVPSGKYRAGLRKGARDSRSTIIYPSPPSVFG